MEDQSSHLERLIEERRRPAEPFGRYTAPQTPPGMTYPVFPQGYKTPHHTMCPPSMGAYGYNAHHALGRRASWQYLCETPRRRVTPDYKEAESPEDLVSHLAVNDPRALGNLRDRIVALQMQNIELNLFLKKEEMKRKEAEDAVRKEKEYVKELQNSLQDLSTSTLVMDPLTYKQVADKYIASRKKPVRRTHTCNPYLGSSDLVCDSTRLQVTKTANQSNSCPSSPLGSNHGRKISTSTSPSSRQFPQRASPEQPLSLSPPLQEGFSPQTLLSCDSNPQPSWSVKAREATPLNSQQYQELLQSLDGLEVSSSPS